MTTLEALEFIEQHNLNMDRNSGQYRSSGKPEWTVCSNGGYTSVRGTGPTLTQALAQFQKELVSVIEQQEIAAERQREHLRSMYREDLLPRTMKPAAKKAAPTKAKEV
jgi:hypothetical protein